MKRPNGTMENLIHHLVVPWSGVVAATIHHRDKTSTRFLA